MSNKEQLQTHNESFQPDEAWGSLKDAPNEYFRKVKAKREFQEKYGDHQVPEEYVPPEGFVKNPDLKPRTGFEQDHQVSIDDRESQKKDKDINDDVPPELGPNEFI